MPIKSTPYLTQPALADQLAVSERTLERWRVEGVGPVYTKAGRRVLYRQQDIESWLEHNRRQSTSQIVRGQVSSHRNANQPRSIEGSVR